MQFVSLPSCSSRFICTRMWDRPVHNPSPCWVCQPPPCCDSSLPSCLSPPLLLVRVSVSLTPWLSDSPTVRFSASSGCFLFLNLLLSLLWLFEEAQCDYLYLHLGWEVSQFVFLNPFTFFTQPPNPLPLTMVSLFSVSMSLFIFYFSFRFHIQLKSYAVCLSLIFT